jgi:O-antigen ligase
MPGRVIHNQYIQLAADCGFLGAGLYIAILVLAFLNFRKVARLARPFDDIDSRRTYLTACGMQTALITFCTGAFFLSLEAFEPQYYLFLCAAVLRVIYVDGVKRAAALPYRAGVTSQPSATRPAVGRLAAPASPT